LQQFESRVAVEDAEWLELALLSDYSEALCPQFFFLLDFTIGIWLIRKFFEMYARLQSPLNTP
jgi:hypothetical protein